MTANMYLMRFYMYSWLHPLSWVVKHGWTYLSPPGWHKCPHWSSFYQFIWYSRCRNLWKFGSLSRSNILLFFQMGWFIDGPPVTGIPGIPWTEGSLNTWPNMDSTEMYRKKCTLFEHINQCNIHLPSIFPPITTKSFNFAPIFASNLKARATFVSGPRATNVISSTKGRTFFILDYHGGVPEVHLHRAYKVFVIWWVGLYELLTTISP